MFNLINRRLKNVLINTCLTLISTLLGVIIVEMFLQFTDMDVPEIVETSRIDGLMLPGYPDFYHFIPHVNTYVVSLTCEFGYPYSINHLGMRDQPRTLKKQDQRTRILFMGDSYTEGVGTAQVDTYPRIIEAIEGDRWECINAGMRGNSPSHAYFRLKKFLAMGLEFDFLVLQLFNNDFNDDRIFTQQFQLTYHQDNHAITRAPFYHCMGEKMQWFGPLAYPLSRTKLFWQIGKLFMGGEPLKPYTVTVTPEQANEIIPIFENAGVMGIQQEKVNNKIKLEFPILSESTLNQKQQDKLWQRYKQPLIKPEMLDQYHHARETMLSQPDSFSVSEKAQQSFHYLDAFRSLCQQNQIPFAIYCAPPAMNINPNFALTIESWCLKNSVPYFHPYDELLTASINSQEAIHHSFDGHLAKRGHHIVANAMVPWLKETISQN